MGNGPLLREKTRMTRFASGTSYYQHMFIDGAEFAVVESDPPTNSAGSVKTYHGGNLTKFIKSTAPFHNLLDAANALKNTKYAIVFIKGIVQVNQDCSFKNTIIASYYDFVDAPGNTKLQSTGTGAVVTTAAFANINFDRVKPVLRGKLVCFLGANIE